MMRQAFQLLMISMAMICVTGAPVLANDLVLPRAVIAFSGVLDLKAEKVALTLGGEGPGAVALEFSRPAGGRYDFKADIRHVTTSWGDVAAVVSGRFELVGADPLSRELEGEVSTRYTLLNYKPVRDVYLKFAVRQRHLIIDPLWFGALSAHGQVGLMGPYDIDMTLDLLSADLDGLWAMLRGYGMKTPPLSGIITGSLTLQGSWAEPLVAGHLAAYNGRMKDLSYDVIDLRFGGTYPVIRFQDGKVLFSDGPSFRIAGSVDLGDLTRLGTQVRQLKREFIVSEGEDERTWAFRLNTSDGHATRLKSFVSGNADGRDQGERVIGLEKHIGF